MLVVVGVLRWWFWIEISCVRGVMWCYVVLLVCWLIVDSFRLVRWVVLWVVCVLLGIYCVDLVAGV